MRVDHEYECLFWGEHNFENKTVIYNCDNTIWEKK